MRPTTQLTLAAAALASAAPARAQRGAARPDSVLRARGLAGSARIALAASTVRLDGVPSTTYSLSPAAFPFIGEHLQAGLAPGYTVSTITGHAAYQAYTVAGVVNYVVGGGARRRGYAGVYASNGHNRYYTGPQVRGVQAGGLFFLAPALAVRAEVRYRKTTSGPFPLVSEQTAIITLDPYLFGRADEGAPAAAGFGAADVAGLLYYDRTRFSAATGATLTVAPYLTRWAQLGASGQVSQSTYDDARGPFTARGFGRLYLPLGARTQPFAEGFLVGTHFGTPDDGLSQYGGTLGVRQMLNARVGLDAGVRRTFEPVRTIGPSNYRYRYPGTTGLVVGLVTRIGRPR